MIVRPFTADEWRTYRALRLRALADSPDAYGSTLDRERAFTDDEWRTRLADGVAASNALPLIALVDGTPAGITWGRISDEEPEVAHVYQVWVAAEHRGRGVGRLLMEAVITWARESGLRAVDLDVTSSNAAAVQLYHRLGFVEVGGTEPLREGSALLRQAMRLVLDADASTNS